MADNKKHMALSIYLIGFLFNTVLTVVVILLPLYGLHLGLSATLIGVLLSAPGIMQIILRFFAGAFSDYLGEKILLTLVFSCIFVAGIFFATGQSFTFLLIAQLFLGMARAVFWPVTQSYASRVPGINVPTMLGRLHGFNESGRMFGIIVGGWAIVVTGYLNLFSSIIFVALLGLIVVLMLPAIPLREGQRKKLDSIFKHLPQLFAIPSVRIAFVISFFAGMFLILVQSFFPIWLKGLGFQENIIGIIIALSLGGSILTGVLFSTLIRRWGYLFLLTLSFIGVSVNLFITLFVSSLVSVTIVSIIACFCGSISLMMYQMVAVMKSEESSRGITLSVVGIGWGLAFLIVPTIIGAMIDLMSVQGTFVSIAIALLIILIFVRASFKKIILDQSEN